MLGPYLWDTWHSHIAFHSRQLWWLQRFWRPCAKGWCCRTWSWELLTWSYSTTTCRPKKLGNSFLQIIPSWHFAKVRFPRFRGVYRPGRRGQRHPNASMGGHRLGSFAATSSWQRDLWCSAYGNQMLMMLYNGHLWDQSTKESEVCCEFFEFHAWNGERAMILSPAPMFCCALVLVLGELLWDIEVEGIGERDWKTVVSSFVFSCFFVQKSHETSPPFFLGGVETEVGQTAFSGVGGDICQEGTARSSLFRSTNHGYLQACALDQKSRFWCLGGCAGQQTTHVKMGHQIPIFEACIHLVISMAGSTGGQRFTVPGGLATEFFKEQLGPELLTVQEPPRGVKGDDGWQEWAIGLWTIFESLRCL